MRNNRFWLYVAVFVVGLLFSIPSYAAENGSCGDNLTWALDDQGQLTISGTGDMNDYDRFNNNQKAPWYEFRSSIVSVTVQSGVTGIGKAAFVNCGNIQDVKLPDSLIRVGEDAFVSCNSLKSITLPDHLTTIGLSAFGYLNSIILYAKFDSDTARSLGKVSESFRITGLPISFRYGNDGDTLTVTDADESILTAEIPDGVTTIGYSAFENCSQLSKLVFPESLTSIEYAAFSGCSSLEELDLPGKIAELSDAAFLNCNAIRYAPVESVTAKTLGKKSLSFRNRGLLYDLMYSFDHADTGELLLISADSDIVEAEIPAGVHEIANCAFSYCEQLKKVHMADTVVSIGMLAFSHCPALSEITLSEGLQIIRDAAFQKCTSLKEIVFPDGINEIDAGAFQDCDAIRYAAIGSETAKALGKSGYSFRVADLPYEMKYQYPETEAVLELIRVLDQEITSATIPEGINIIGGSVFKACEKLTEITIPGSVTEIGDYAFSACENLTDITISEGVTKIGDHAFSTCKNLTEITIPGGVTEIGDYAFSHCKKLKAFSIPASVKKIGRGVLSYCDQLLHVTILAEAAVLTEDSFSKTIAVSAPENSETYRQLKEYGIWCAGLEGSIALKHPLSTDPAKPTRTLAASGASVDLSNKKKITVKNVLNHYHHLDEEGRETTDSYLETVKAQKWEYTHAAYQTRSTILLLCVDAENHSFWSEPYYLQYGVADLKIPEPVSPKLTYTKDGYVYLAHEDLKLTWAASEDAVYDVWLWQELDVYEEDEDDTLWKKKNLESNTCTIPKEVMPPDDDPYILTINVISKSTGERRTSESYFWIYGTDYVTERAQITSPFISAPMMCSGVPGCYPSIPYEGDLKVEWDPVPNAVYYKLHFWMATGGSSYRIILKEIVKEKTSYTVEKGYFHHLFSEGDLFALAVEAYDKYDRSSGLTIYHFRFGDSSPLGVKIGKKKITYTMGKWTSISPGKQTFTWNKIKGAKTYDFYLVRVQDGQYYQAMKQGSMKSSTLSQEVTLEKGNRYILCLAAKDGLKNIESGWYFLDVRSDKYTPLTILNPSDEYLALSDIKVTWTKAGNQPYTVSLRKKDKDDYETLEDPFGHYGLSYNYSILVKEYSEVRKNTCTFDRSLLEYGGMYCIVVKTTDAQGEEIYAEAVFRIEGDRKKAPTLNGVFCSENHIKPAGNLKWNDLKIIFSEGNGAVSYESSLYELQDNGKQPELIAVANGDQATMKFKANRIRGGKRYMLVLRAYDSDGFCQEYRRYFLTEDSKALECLRIPAAMKTIEDETWRNNQSLKWVKIPSGITAIGEKAFSGCKNLCYAEIPSTVTSIADNAFAGCKNLVIYTRKNSYAAQYAEKQGIKVLFVK